MDEAVHELRVDPVSFRLRLLDGAGRNARSAPDSVGGAKRQAAMLSRVAQKAGWGSVMPNDVGLSVASSFGQERDMPTWCACVARVPVDRTNGQIVEKLTLVVDAGTIIQPDDGAAQVEGSALGGLSMALYEGTEFVMGQPKDTNLDTYSLLRMGNVPEVEIEFMPSTEAPMGLGEPATAVIAPAIGNAIFAATGARLRHLPMRPENIRQTLARRS
jgi:isoquinoline 1-oxidoreductase beta subunit